MGTLEDRRSLINTASKVSTIEKEDTKLVQILNISPSVTLEQITALFSILGNIINIELYDSNDSDTNDELQQQQLQNNNTNIFKVCFIEFAKSSSVVMAQHLTNTVFIDRALTVLPYESTKAPDRDTCMKELVGCKFITNFNLGVTNQVMNSVGGAQVIATIDPRLSALGLPQYPHLPVNTDPNRIEEIRRTVYIGNLDSTVPPDQVLKFFNDIGEVKYIRMAGDDTQPTRFAFVEFNHQASVTNALQHNGFILGSRALKINHSNNAIVKPQIKLIEQQQTPNYQETETTLKKAHNDRDLVTTRDYESRDDRKRHHSSSSRYDKERSRDRGRERREDRRISPKEYRTSSHRRSRSRENLRKRRRSRSREGDLSSRSKRSRSKDNISRRRSRSRESSSRNKTSSRRSRSRSSERSKSSRHHHDNNSRR